jgi:hypothetical protein
MNGHPYDRVNMLIRAAFIMAGLLTLAVILGDYAHLSAATQTTLGVILGRVWGYLDSIFAFEFGTTRNSKQKDETIKELSKAAAAPEDSTIRTDQVNVNSEQTNVVTGGGEQQTVRPPT